VVFAIIVVPVAYPRSTKPDSQEWLCHQNPVIDSRA
jgi:hypothetical protein